MEEKDDDEEENKEGEKAYRNGHAWSAESGPDGAIDIVGCLAAADATPVFIIPVPVPVPVSDLDPDPVCHHPIA